MNMDPSVCTGSRVLPATQIFPSDAQANAVCNWFGSYDHQQEPRQVVATQGCDPNPYTTHLSFNMDGGMSSCSWVGDGNCFAYNPSDQEMGTLRTGCEMARNSSTLPSLSLSTSPGNAYSNIHAFPDCQVTADAFESAVATCSSFPEISLGTAHLHDWAFPNYPEVVTPAPPSNFSSAPYWNTALYNETVPWPGNTTSAAIDGFYDNDSCNSTPETVGSESYANQETKMAIHLSGGYNTGIFVNPNRGYPVQTEQPHHLFRSGTHHTVKIQQPTYQLDTMLPPYCQPRPVLTPTVPRYVRTSSRPTVGYVEPYQGQPTQLRPEHPTLLLKCTPADGRSEEKIRQAHRPVPVGLEPTRTKSAHSLTTHPYECEQCGKRYKHKCNLITHRKIHSPSAPTCSYCGKRFTNKKDLIRHERTHTGVKPYACEVCGKRFNDQANRRKHMGLHTGMKKYSCAFCHKQFCYRSSVKRHIGASEPCQRLFHNSTYESEKDAVIPVA